MATKKEAPKYVDVTLEEYEARKKKPKSALKGFLRGAGRVAGSVAKTAAAGVYETGKSFAEGAGIPKPTTTGVAHTVGHVTGQIVGGAVRGAVKTAGKVEVRSDSTYFWGKGGGPVSSFLRKELKDYTPSTLPTQIQAAIHNYIANLHPEIREAIKEGVAQMPLSEFVGKLRVRYPEIYEQARLWVYEQIGRQQYSAQPGYETYGQRPSTAPGGGYVIIQR